MDSIECTARKWGNSIGITLPHDIVMEKGIQSGQRVVVSVKRKSDLSPLFGSVKFRKSSQELKDEMRKGW
jgi:antitoxin component of MazEF toxin-antitoxin module